MAAIIVLLKALARALHRELRTFFSFKLNNLFLLSALMAYTAIVSNMKPWAAVPFFLLLGLLMLFPMSSDPLAKIPPSRLSLWPLSGGQRFALRMTSLALSPILWITLAFLLFSGQMAVAIVFLVVALTAQGLAAIGMRAAALKPNLYPLRHLPRLPGRLGGLIRLNLRQLLSVLDFYATLVLAISAAAYRWFDAKADPEGFAPLAMLIALTLSTATQSSFSLDSDSGLTRYSLLPLRGWQVLAAKDAAFFAVLLVLILPLAGGSTAALRAGLTFGFMAVALGRYPSLVLQPAQHRWRFTSGDFRFGALQIILGSSMGFAEFRLSGWFLPAAFAAYLVSLLAGARYWDWMNRPEPVRAVPE